MWTVEFTSQAAKQTKKLPLGIQQRLQALVCAMEEMGPVQGHWQNYSKLSRDIHHCHLTYRYVAVWKVEDKKDKRIGVVYVGSREKAPY